MEQKRKYEPIILDNYQSIIPQGNVPFSESEEAMEKDLINRLVKNGYIYRNDIKNKESLINNLREKIEKINNVKLSDKDWNELKDKWLFKRNSILTDKTDIIQGNSLYNLNINGTSKNINLFDKENLDNNFFEVINQYEANNSKTKNRYDVTILINGLPLVHIELKKRGQEIEKAFGQIRRYEFESFSSGEESKIFQFVQIFIISNGTFTKYFANSVREIAVDNFQTNTSKKVKVFSDNFKYTSFWTDRQNRKISDIIDFANTFLQKNTIFSIIVKYCVFDSDNVLKVMRPYQIAATESILAKVDQAIEDPTLFDSRKKNLTGGYVWHTTGSGKTLTSFKVATLITQNINNKYQIIDKVLFIVDRRDLNVQTFKSFNKFKKESAVSPDSTNDLKNKLLKKDNDKLIVTTIQKLAKLVKDQSIKKQNLRMIFIFDECHRSQFGTQHEYIIRSFDNSLIFGFTGTPIFKINSTKGTADISKIEINSSSTRQNTTEEIFGNILHKYSMAQAINDENVLKFNLEIAGLIGLKDQEEQSEETTKHSINTDAIWNAPERIRKNVEYILKNFENKTVGGRFNSIFASYSIDTLRRYYDEFKEQQKDIDPLKKLKIAAIFSYEPNKTNENDFQILSNDINTEAISGFDNLSESDKQVLARIVKDYNEQFGTKFSIDNASAFADYNNDISRRLGNIKEEKKDRIDILLVVNMYLTGFDAVKLNTLWLDKPLKYHSLIQAISRTNRIYDAAKPFGNIVSFVPRVKSDLKEAIRLFCGENHDEQVLIKDFEDYYNGFDHKDFKRSWKEIVEVVRFKTCSEWNNSDPEQKKHFVNIFGQLLERRNYLTNFEKWYSNKELWLMTPYEFNNYKAIYNELYRKQNNALRSKQININESLAFKNGLADSTDIGIDYIWKTINEIIINNSQHEKSNTISYKTIDEQTNAIRSSNVEHLKADKIRSFLIFFNSDYYTGEQRWEMAAISSVFIKEFVEFSKNDHNIKIDELIEKYNLDGVKFRNVYENCFKKGEINLDPYTISSFFKEKKSSFSKEFKNLKKNFETEIYEYFNSTVDILKLND
ncbi:type I restriction endonuclease subunit R [Mycoplasma phocimorsus]|uniref:type I restriction endonuclease subunit R n=1 Tax=Mycoplasma phocimorsus TaxID=3045839 RepID=UPI0024BF13C7|nr:type I restriction endonuclease subunit R [Mycoplasma phocimorsus]MDJ1649081.1 type I restriction endonuclease subunit R [Mycoplasma phocimorsus]